MEDRKSPFISVIVPVYKVENYLNRCINSILNQSFGDIEVILVDDGSPDYSPMICEEWKRKDERVTVIHKKNEGLGFARNSGLHIARGQYISFIDSDDYIEQGLFEEAVRVIEQCNPDLIEFGYKRVNNAAVETAIHIPRLEREWYQGNEEIRRKVLPELFGTNPHTGYASNLMLSAWTKLYKRTVLQENRLQFLSEREILSEDIYFIAQLYAYVDSVCILSKAYYCYCMNQNSLTTIYDHNRFDKSVFFYLRLKELCLQYGYNEEVLLRIQIPFMDWAISSIKMEVAAAKQKGLKHTYKEVKRICSNDLLQKIVKEYPRGAFHSARRILNYCIGRGWTVSVIMLVWMWNKRSG